MKIVTDSKPKYIQIMNTKEITPKEFSCGIGGCPVIFKTDRETYIIVGKVPAGMDLTREVLEKMSSGHLAVEVPVGVIDMLTSRT
jgi:hypothetical protein